MSLLDAITSLGIKQLELGLPQYNYSESSWPNTVKILANWGTVLNKNMVVVGNREDSTKSVDFGNVKMYPVEFRKDDISDLDYVLILPNYTEHNSFIYCYAIEVELTKKTDFNGNFIGYSGFGAFTMAYNSDVGETARYTPRASTVFPSTYELTGSQSVSNGRIYLEAIFEPFTNSSGKKFMRLGFYLIDSSREDWSRYEIAVYDLPIDYYNDYPISTIAKAYSNIELNKFVVDTNANPLTGGKTSPYLYNIISDLQVITRDDEADLANIYYGSSSQQGNYLQRSAYLNYFAFNSDLTEDIVIKKINLSAIENKLTEAAGMKSEIVYAIRDKGKQETKQNTLIKYSIPVTIGLDIKYDVSYKSELVKKHNALGQWVGGNRDVYPVLSFSGSGRYKATGNINTLIGWEYRITRDRSSIKVSDLVGKIIPSIGTFTYYKTETVEVNSPVPLPYWWGSAPTSENFYKTLDISNFGILASYVLWKPSQDEVADLYWGNGLEGLLPSINRAYIYSFECLMLAGYEKTSIVINSDGNYRLVENTNYINLLENYVDTTIKSKSLINVIKKAINIIKNFNCFKVPANALCRYITNVNRTFSNSISNVYSSWNLEQPNFVNAQQKTGLSVTKPVTVITL